MLNNPPRLTAKAAQSLDKVRDIFTRLVALDQSKRGFIAEALYCVISRKYSGYLRDNFENYRDRQDDLDELIDFVYNYESLEKLLADLTLDENFAGKSDHAASRNLLILSTIHQAKGLEWPNVFVIGLRDGAFPHYKSLGNPSELEEERRLFYVAVTRAQNELVLLYPHQTTNREYFSSQMSSGPSMFIKELDRKKYSTLNRFGIRYSKDDEDGVIRYD